MIYSDFIPPIAKKIFKDLSPKYGFCGNFKTWGDAQNASSGYDSSNILKKVKDSLLRVKQGKAAYERDSITFDKIQYSTTILAALALIKNNDAISVLDFGGSLGSTYFQNKKILELIGSVKWGIVEQKSFVECGKKYFEDSQLKFYPNIQSCVKDIKPSSIIFSSVLQYLENPYAILSEAIKNKFEYIIIDRTPFSESGEKIVIQKNPSKIYKASYPCHIFDEAKFKKMLLKDYSLAEDFENSDYLGKNIKFKGFIFRKNGS